MARVLLTRDAGSCEATARRLAGAGHAGVLLPLAVHKDLGIPVPPGLYRGIVFTSAVAPRLLAARAGGVDLVSKTAFCIGRATAEAARTAGFADIVVSQGDAAALAQAVGRTQSGSATGDLLYPSARERAFDMAAAIPQAGIVGFDLYETDYLDPGGPALAEAVASSDAAFFYSPRAAGHVAELADRHRLRAAVAGLTLIAISEKTARAARARLGIPVRVAQEPEERAMVALL